MGMGMGRLATRDGNVVVIEDLAGMLDLRVFSTEDG